MWQLEEEAFNPDYTEVDRILDVMDSLDAISGKNIRHYLVKWKALPYEDSTWELEDDVDTLKVSAEAETNERYVGLNSGKEGYVPRVRW